MSALLDLDQYIGADVAVSGSGDLQSCFGTVRSEQRILRRLLTNPGDYIFHPDYGAGLSCYVGETADVAKLQALVKGQMLLEAVVARTPAPIVSVSQVPSADGGGFAIAIRYTDATTGRPTSLSFSVGG